MKKSAIVIAFILTVLAGTASAQDTFSVAIGLEVDGYTVGETPLVAVGPHIALDYRFNELFSLGARGIYVIDLGQATIGDVAALELGVGLRLYFLRFKELVDYWFEWQHKYHYFVQLDVAYNNIFSSANVDVAGVGFTVGGTIGCRIFVKESMFVEPYGRFGANMSKDVTALNWGVGVLVGYTFHSGRGGY